MKHGAPYAGLQRLNEFPLPIYTSSGHAPSVHRLATRFVRAYAFLHETFALTPPVGLLILSPQDWPQYAGFPTYGLTHYDPAQRMVITGSQLGTFWYPILDLIGATSPDVVQDLQVIYPQAHNRVDVTAHVDTWIVHDLGHAFHLSESYWFPRTWLMELFADLCVYTYLALHEPQHLPALETLPHAVRGLPVQVFRYQTLSDFETRYINMEAANYLWYHGQFFAHAQRVYQVAGRHALQRLWRTFVVANVQTVSDTELIALLQTVQPELAQVVRAWPSAAQQ